MKKRARWFLMMTNLVMLSSVFLSAGWVYGQAPVVKGQVSFRAIPPAAGTVTYIAYLKKGGETDNQILTEDNLNAQYGPDRGYDGSEYYVDTENFDNPHAFMGDTLVILFTGIGAELDSAGSVTDTLDTSVGIQDFPNSTWGVTSNPNTPICRQSSSPPGWWTSPGPIQSRAPSGSIAAHRPPGTTTPATAATPESPRTYP